MKSDIRHILVIVNPASGQARSLRNVEMFIDALHNLGATTRTLHTQGIADARDIATREGANYDLVIACGGDGTLSEVVSGLLALEAPPQAPLAMWHVPSVWQPTLRKPLRICFTVALFPLISARFCGIRLP